MLLSLPQPCAIGLTMTKSNPFCNFSVVWLSFVRSWWKYLAVTFLEKKENERKNNQYYDFQLESGTKREGVSHSKIRAAIGAAQKAFKVMSTDHNFIPKFDKFKINQNNVSHVRFIYKNVLYLFSFSFFFCSYLSFFFKKKMGVGQSYIWFL